MTILGSFLLWMCILLFGSEQPTSEKHLKNLRQLTSGGENAEAYFSFDGKKLIFQSTRADWPCDQIYVMNIDGSGVQQVSTGKGRTTCAYFLKDGKRFLYSSTHLGSAECPPKPDYSRGYVWPIDKNFDIFLSDFKGKLTRLTETPGYDAEATVSPDGKKIVFTSVRDGDLELYSMNVDGTGVRRLTHRVGYDGGAFFSPDGQKIVYRASYPADEKAKARYQALLGRAFGRATTVGFVCHECRWLQSGSGDKQSRRQFLSLLSSRREANHLCVERQRSQRAQLRSLHREPRRHRVGTNHVQRNLRWVPHVFA